MEAVVAVGLLTILTGFAVPMLSAARDDARARGAADYLASRLHSARIEALKRHANVAVRFEPATVPDGCAVYTDANGNGVRTAEIDAGIDTSIRQYEAVHAQFPGVALGLDNGVPDLEGDLGGDGVRVGRSRMVSFSPEGMSTSGTIYVLGRGRRQYAVRVLGPTGRVRVFEYVSPSGQWRPR